jgi:ParB-like chromosome segregation protein Spo0J
VAAGVSSPGRVLLELDPRQLQENPHNPRTDLGDLTELTELTASIRAVGVLEPLIVTPTDGGGHLLLFGHRRRAAAIEAGLATVPCDVRADYAGKSAEQIADMLAENLHRRDLTGLEEAAGYEQLSMFDGWTPERRRLREAGGASDVSPRSTPTLQSIRTDPAAVGLRPLRPRAGCAREVLVAYSHTLIRP